MSAISKVVYGNTPLIDLTADTVEASKLLKDYTAHGADGELITGTCEYDADTSDAEIDDVDDELSITSGYHDGTGVAKLDATEKAKIVAENIKNGVSILGVTGSYTGEGVPTEQVTVTPYTTAQTVLPTTGYNISQVNVNAIYYSETANSGGGITATIGQVAPTTP